MIKGIHHIAIIASSEKSVMFYDSLGFKEKYRKVRTYDTVVLLEGYGLEIEIFIDPSHKPKTAEPLGLRHFALKVENCELMKEKFECGRIERDWLGRNYCFTSDPDGNKIEFHE